VENCADVFVLDVEGDIAYAKKGADLPCMKKEWKLRMHLLSLSSTAKNGTSSAIDIAAELWEPRPSW
jgi:hypothetical protein